MKTPNSGALMIVDGSAGAADQSRHQEVQLAGTAQSITAAAERNPALIYLASLQPTGRRSMLARLKLVAQLLGRDVREVEWAALRFEHISAIRSKLLEMEHSPASINATLAALRGVARAAWNLGLMTAEDYQRLKSVGTVRGSRLPAGRAITPGEVVALFDACAKDESPAGARDAAMLALIIGAGLRRSEAAAGIDLSNYAAETGELRVRGKGNKERVAYLTGGAQEAVEDWLNVRGRTDGPLLCPVLKSGKIVLRRLSDQAIYNALRKRGLEAKVKRFSPHDGRRTFISDLLDAGADISAVQQLVGHANVSTTARYDRRGERAKKKAAALLHLPYRSRVR